LTILLEGLFYHFLRMPGRFGMFGRCDAASKKQNGRQLGTARRQLRTGFGGAAVGLNFS